MIADDEDVNWWQQMMMVTNVGDDNYRYWQ